MLGITKFGSGEDGRLNSALMEKKYLDMLEEKLTRADARIVVQRPPARHWYDIMINNIPINLKLTSGGSDNAFNKTAITYTLLGCVNPDMSAINRGFSEWYEYIKTHHDPTSKRNPEKEYHYLVINKNTPSRVLFKSIIDINTYRSNPSNILQIKWKHEFNHYGYKVPTAEFHQKKLELMSCIQTSLIKEYNSKRRFIDAILDDDLGDCNHNGKKRKRNN
jgi:hypothetical protein